MMKAKEILEFLKIRRNLDLRMVEIKETMDLTETSEVYANYVCKMNDWAVGRSGYLAKNFCEISFAFSNGYIKALRDNGFHFVNGLVKPMSPTHELPSGAARAYEDDLRREVKNQCVEALREIMKDYEPSSTQNQNRIVSEFKKEIEL